MKIQDGAFTSDLDYKTHEYHKKSKHCTNQGAYAERTQEAKLIHGACLEPLFDCRFASVQAEVLAVGSSFFVCSLQAMESIVNVEFRVCQIQQYRHVSADHEVAT